MLRVGHDVAISTGEKIRASNEVIRAMNWQILQGDVRERLAEIPAGTVQTCVTSPPYWGLRDYGHDGQIGLEPTPDAYCASMVAVFAAVREALADDGTLWLNLGDSYAGSGPSGASYQSVTTKAREGKSLDGQFRISGTLKARGLSYAEKKPIPPPGLKSKDLCGIPWRVAFALQADGWYLRSDIIWHKPNPMPESVTDRPTKAHEYIFLLTKSARYYYDADAIAEAASESMLAQMEQGYEGLGLKDYESVGVQNPSTVKARIIANARLKAGPTQHKQTAVGNNQGGYLGTNAPFITRNKRTVWTVATAPYPEAHFATYPPALIEPCILAGSRVGDTVLDPFNGSGTTGEVAIRHQRNYIGIELNPAYIELARKRIGAVAPMFAQELTA